MTRTVDATVQPATDCTVSLSAVATQLHVLLALRLASLQHPHAHSSPRFIDTSVRVPVGSARLGSFGRAVSHVRSITNIDTL